VSEKHPSTMLPDMNNESYLTTRSLWNRRMQMYSNVSLEAPHNTFFRNIQQEQGVSESHLRSTCSNTQNYSGYTHSEFDILKFVQKLVTYTQ